MASDTEFCPDPDWREIRKDYSAPVLTTGRLCAKHKVSHQQLTEHAARNKWGPRPPAAQDRLLLIASLMALLERQIGHVEETMGAVGDKEVALLGNLVRTLERLIALERAEKGRGEGTGETAEMLSIRKSLEKRINALTKP